MNNRFLYYKGNCAVYLDIESLDTKYCVCVSFYTHVTSRRLERLRLYSHNTYIYSVQTIAGVYCNF